MKQSNDETAMKDFRELDALHAAHDLVVEIHDISQSFPEDDTIAIGRSIARTALAIPRSIVHGCGRGGNENLAQALETAGGYTSELEYLVLLAGEIGVIDEETLEELAVSLNDFKKRLGDELAEL